MCLLVVASQVVADEPLIVGANRDEVLERPSTSVTVLDDGPPRILGGRDELSGGTWLAVNEHGVCAGLTNQPLGDAKDPSKRSRGELPLALARHATAAAAVDGPAPGVPARGLQRLVVAGGRPHLALLRRLHRSRDPASAVALPPGIHVLENRALGEASLKVDLVRDALGRPDPGRRGGGGLPPRPGRPPDPRGGGTPERGQLRASRVVRDPLVVHRPGGRRRRPAADVGGRRTPVRHAVRRRSAVCGPERRRPGRGRLSRGRAACSAAGGAGRPRRRGACAGRPRSR